MAGSDPSMPTIDYVVVKEKYADKEVHSGMTKCEMEVTPTLLLSFSFIPLTSSLVPYHIS